MAKAHGAVSLPFAFSPQPSALSPFPVRCRTLDVPGTDIPAQFTTIGHRKT